LVFTLSLKIIDKKYIQEFARLFCLHQQEIKIVAMQCYRK